MVWLKIPGLVAAIMDGDGPTSCEKWMFSVATKTSGNIHKCPYKQVKLALNCSGCLTALLDCDNAPSSPPPPDVTVS